MYDFINDNQYLELHLEIFWKLVSFIKNYVIHYDKAMTICTVAFWIKYSFHMMLKVSISPTKTLLRQVLLIQEETLLAHEMELYKGPPGLQLSPFIEQRLQEPPPPSKLHTSSEWQNTVSFQN